MDPTVGAAVVSGASDLIGGIAGRSGNKKALGDAMHQFNRQLQFAQYQQQISNIQFNRNFKEGFWDRREGEAYRLKRLIRAGEQMGLHPLATIGGGSGSAFTPVGSTMPGGPSPALASVQPEGENWSRMGETLARVISGDAKRERERDKLDLEREKAEIELINARRVTEENSLENQLRQNPDLTKKLTDDNDAVDVETKLRMPDGTIRTVLVGPDIDEVITGGITYIWDKIADQWVPKPEVAEKNAEKSGKRTGGKKVQTVPEPSTGSRNRRR